MFKFEKLDWNTQINNMSLEKFKFFEWESTYEKVFLNNKLIGYYIIEEKPNYSVTSSKVYSQPRGRFFIPLDVEYSFWINNLKKYQIRLDNYPKPLKIYIKEEILKIIERNPISV